MPHPMRRIHPAGLFEAICPLPPAGAAGKYLLQTADERGNRATMHDPYAFPNVLTEFDLYLLNEGTHWQSYDRLGATYRSINGVPGVNFAVWAPNATSVSLIGDFNGWDGRRHPMRKHIPSGFWELFVPGLSEDTLYKYRVKHGDQVFEKSDPYGFAAELPPKTASKVVNLDRYHWCDNEWMATRQEANKLDAPFSFYEVHLGSWKSPGDDHNRWLSYRELAHELVDYGRGMGFTHMSFAGQRASVFGSWGYQPVGYYAPTSRYGGAARFHVLRRPLPPGGDGSGAGLGAGALPARRARPASVRRHGSL